MGKNIMTYQKRLNLIDECLRRFDHPMNIKEIQEYCMELFGENVQIAAASHDLFAKRVNGQIYRPLVEKYIAGEKRL